MAYFNYKNKSIYFEEIGEGEPLILLHGNTASSKMFSTVIDLYKDNFKVVLIDFLGHGKSDRLGEFPTDLWYDEAMQVIELIKCNHYEKVNIIGTSGGALVALNVALERGDLVHKVIADSFEGETAVGSLAESIFDERHQAKAGKEERMFWEYCHGSDWESVVDNDTDAIISHSKSIKNFFHKDVSQLNVPVMLTASLEDEYAGMIDFDTIYSDMLEKIPNGKMHFFLKGGHPAMISNGVGFSEIAKKFIKGER